MALSGQNCVPTKAIINFAQEMVSPLTTSTITNFPASSVKKTITTSDPGILCFHHCCVKVFCFVLPRVCPQCKMELYDEHDNNDNSNKNTNINNSNVNINNTITNHTTNGRSANKQDTINNGYIVEEQFDLQQQQPNTVDMNGATELLNNRLLPFRLPYPFIRASQYPCAIILRPTMGDFLNDYNNTTDLHIAVTTSTGCVVEFDRYGLRSSRTDNMPEWWQCLLVGDVPEPWYDYWDQILLQVCQRPNKWTIAQYHKDKYNCYTFVLTFLQELAYDKLSEAAKSRTTFCEKYIVPRTTTAGKYISLYRKLRVTGIYVHQIVQQYNNSNKKNNKHNMKNSCEMKCIMNRQNCNNNDNNRIAPIKCRSISINSSNNNLNNDNNNNQNIINQNHNSTVDLNVTTIPNSSNCIGNNRRNSTGDINTGVDTNCLIVRPHSTLCTIEE